MDSQPTDAMAPLGAGEAIASRSRGVGCVFLSCFDQSVRFFASMLSLEDIQIYSASTVEMADFLLLATGGTVLVSDTTFLDGSWEDALAMIQTHHSGVATLICADPIDRQFVASATERGAFEVLWRPIELPRLRSSILAAHERAVERCMWLAERRPERRSDGTFYQDSARTK